MSFHNPPVARQNIRDILFICKPLKQTHCHIGNSILTYVSFIIIFKSLILFFILYFSYFNYLSYKDLLLLFIFHLI